MRQIAFRSDRLIVLGILIYVALSSFLRVEGSARITYPDIFMILLMALAGLRAVHSNHFYLLQPYRFYLILLFLFTISGAISQFKNVALLELIILAFLAIGSICIFNLLQSLSDIERENFYTNYILLIGILAFLSFIDFAFGLGILSHRSIGGLEGSFRNTGQAGSFYGIHLAIMIALFQSRIARRNLATILSIVFALIALMLTFKRASILGFLVGSGLYYIMLIRGSISGRTRRRLLISGALLLLLVPMLYMIFQWSLTNVPGAEGRFRYKFSSSALDVKKSVFIAENIKSTIEAISDRPFFGVGLGNVSGVYQSHEVHSSYLGILAYGGLIGFIMYCVFMYSTVRLIWKGGMLWRHNKYADFLKILLPYFVGLAVAWGYTYHLRKREFWLLMAIIAVAYQMRKAVGAIPSGRRRKARNEFLYGTALKFPVIKREDASSESKY